MGWNQQLAMEGVPFRKIPPHFSNKSPVSTSEFFISGVTRPSKYGTHHSPWISNVKSHSIHGTGILLVYLPTFTIKIKQNVGNILYTSPMDLSSELDQILGGFFPHHLEKDIPLKWFNSQNFFNPKGWWCCWRLRNPIQNNHLLWMYTTLVNNGRSTTMLNWWPPDFWTINSITNLKFSSTAIRTTVDARNPANHLTSMKPCK